MNTFGYYQIYQQSSLCVENRVGCQCWGSYTSFCVAHYHIVFIFTQSYH